MRFLLSRISRIPFLQFDDNRDKIYNQQERDLKIMTVRTETHRINGRTDAPSLPDGMLFYTQMTLFGAFACFL